MELSANICHATLCWQASHATFCSQSAMQQKCCLLKSFMQTAMQHCAGKPPMDGAKHTAPTWMLQLNSATLIGLHQHRSHHLPFGSVTRCSLPETTVHSCQRSVIRQFMVDLLHLPARDLVWGKCLFHTLTTVSSHAKHAEVQP